MARKKRSSNIRAGVEPAHRLWTKWTPELIRIAELRADTGHLKEAARLCDWMFGDDKIGPLLHGRAQYLLGLVPEFEPSGDKRRSNRAVKALEAGEDWWASFPEDELSLLITWGILLGVAPAQHQWLYEQGHGERILPKPSFWHPVSVRFDQDAAEWKTLVAGEGVLRGPQQEIAFAPGDGQWILHTPYGRHRPWTYGLWRGLSRMALLKAYAVADWAVHSKNAATLAVTSGNQEVETSHEQRTELANDIKNRGKESVVVLPATFDIKLVEATANTRDIYQAQIDMANDAIAIAIRGGNLTTSVTSGSLAATEAQERLGDDAKRIFDAAALATTIHDQSLTWWAKYNFGDSMLAPWPVWPVESKEDRKGLAEAMDKSSKALMTYVGLGFEVDHDAYAEEFGVSSFLRKATKPKTTAPTSTESEPTKVPVPDED